MKNKIAIAIHGGAGTILRSEMTEQRENAYRYSLQSALDAGYTVLDQGGTAEEAVIASIMVLEDDPLFNAGRGSVYTHNGIQEMDAAIMLGQNLEAGAIAGVRNVRNPILLAQSVMHHSGHVLLSGKGASDFALKMNIKMEPEEYFFNEAKYQQWLAARNTDSYMLDHISEKKLGTVGCVALDQHGNLAAGTSTGGMTNKRYGRIGDSPIIGSGTYANNSTCAISCTGHGELFLRSVVGHDVSALMEYKGLSLQEACDIVVKDKLVKIGGEGGLIAVDHLGNICLSFNSEGMYRGSRNAQESYIGIYAD